MIYAKPGIFSQRVAVPVSDAERLMWCVLKIAMLAIALLWLCDSCDPAYAEAQPLELDAGVADYSERDIADLYISNAMYRSVLVRMVLARTVMAESNFNVVDGAAVLHVLSRRAEAAGIPIESMARRYSSSHKVRQTARLRWIRSTEPSCSEPDGWPSNLKWSDHEAGCLAVFQLVDRFLHGEVPDPCSGRSDHWGSSTDRPNPRWIRISCGPGVANRFYRERGGVVDALKAKGSSK